MIYEDKVATMPTRIIYRTSVTAVTVIRSIVARRSSVIFDVTFLFHAIASHLSISPLLLHVLSTPIQRKELDEKVVSV